MEVPVLPMDVPQVNEVTWRVDGWRWYGPRSPTGTTSPIWYPGCRSRSRSSAAEAFFPCSSIEWLRANRKTKMTATGTRTTIASTPTIRSSTGFHPDFGGFGAGVERVIKTDSSSVSSHRFVGTQFVSVR
jgi:hypothetical protein